MNRLPVIVIAASLTAIVATVPANAKSPAPLAGEARNESDALRTQLGALWNSGRTCPADAAPDFMPQRRAQVCTVQPAHVSEASDTMAMEPRADDAIEPR